MPSEFKTFRRQLFGDAVLKMAREITLAAGYNTQPFVTDDPRLARTSSEEFTLLMVEGDEDPSSVTIGGCFTLELTIELYGYVRNKDSNPRTQLNKLIQDTRNSMSQNLGRICDFIDAGTSMSFGIVETDKGMLAQDGQATFAMPVIFTYKAGPVW